MNRSLVRCGVTLALAAAATLGCNRQSPPKVPLATKTADNPSAAEAAHSLLGPAAKAALDSGNSLFRKKVFDGALAQYRAASALAPQHSAPLFGIYMVARATKDSAMADSALAGIRQRSGMMTAAPHSLGDSTQRRVHDSLKRRPSAG